MRTGPSTLTALPTGAKHDRGPARPAQVRELASVPSHDEPDAWSPGAGVVEHARVHQGGVDGAVGARGGHDCEALVGGDQAANEIELSGHPDCLHPSAVTRRVIRSAPNGE